MKEDEIRKAVREHYARIATGEKSPRSAGEIDVNKPQAITSVASCCAPQETTSAATCCAPQEMASKVIGYTDNELGVIPDGARVLGLSGGSGRQAGPGG